MRLDQLHQRLGDAISVRWLSFLLRPEPKTPDQTRFVEYTRSWERPAEMESAATFRVWATDNPQPSSSLPPHVAAKAVEMIEPDRSPAMHRRLLTAYFTENRTISDWDVLRDVAADVGVDPDALTAAVDEHGESITDRVIDEHNEAIANGINAVPTTLIGGVLAVPGAQDVDTLALLVNRFTERQDIRS